MPTVPISIYRTPSIPYRILLQPVDAAVQTLGRLLIFPAYLPYPSIYRTPLYHSTYSTPPSTYRILLQPVDASVEALGRQLIVAERAEQLAHDDVWPT